MYPVSSQGVGPSLTTQTQNLNNVVVQQIGIRGN